MTDLTSASRKKLVKSWIDETGFTPQKPNWFKRLVSNVRIWFHNHGIKIKHLSDDDIANIILRSAKAARAERRSSVVKENLTTGEGARFLAVGDKFSQIKDALPQEEGKAPLFTEKYNSVSKILPKLAEIFSKFPNDIVAADGATVLIKNPDKGKISERLKHLITQEGKKNGDRNFYDIDKKIPWLPRIVETLENAQAKLKDPVTGNFAYVRSYTDGKIHTVLVSESGSIQAHDTFDHGLITQFAERFAGRRNSFEVVWERDASKQKSSLQTASQMGSSEKFPRPLRQGKYTSDSQEINPVSEKNPQKTGTDKSDGNAMFSLESSGSEELKLQVEAMHSLVGYWLDQDGAEYARRFKEKYNITLDPEEAKLIAALAISKNASARSKKAVTELQKKFCDSQFFSAYARTPLFLSSKIFSLAASSKHPAEVSSS